MVETERIQSNAVNHKESAWNFMVAIRPLGAPFMSERIQNGIRSEIR